MTQLKIVQYGDLIIEENGLSAYMPIELSFGENQCDGMGNPVPDDPGTIYISIGSSMYEHEPTTISVTLDSLVEYFLESTAGCEANVMADIHHDSAEKLVAELRRLAIKIEAAKTVVPSIPMLVENCNATAT